MRHALILALCMSGAQACTGPGTCPTQPPNITSKDFCYSARIRSTVLQGLPFGGVPTVLALDFMCFLVSLSFNFTCVSRREPVTRARPIYIFFVYISAIIWFFIWLHQDRQLCSRRVPTQYNTIITMGLFLCSLNSLTQVKKQCGCTLVVASRNTVLSARLSLLKLILYHLTFFLLVICVSFYSFACL